MRVTNGMLVKQAISGLDVLRERYAKAQAQVNGRALDRPSEDPQRVMEAMDLSGVKMRLARARKAGGEATDRLANTEHSLTMMIDLLQNARETVMQGLSTSGIGEESSMGLAEQLLTIREALLHEMNGRHRDQYIFAGWNTDTRPFEVTADSGVTYAAMSDGAITREMGQELPVAVNVPGSRLVAAGDFIKVLWDMAQDMQSGRAEAAANRLPQLDEALDNLVVIRSEVGIRQQQVDRYSDYTEDAILRIEDRLSKVSGTDLEDAVIRMMEAQQAYQAALASFSKALPASLLDYMLG